MDDDENLRLIKKKEVCRLTSYSPAHIDRMVREQKFPNKVTLGQARVAWLEREVHEWLKARIAERQDPKPPTDDDDA